MIIQIMGLPGSGKTTLAKELASRINAMHFNGDKLRADMNTDLTFSVEHRIEQARRMGALARLTSEQGYMTVIDFVCPTEETRTAFGKADIVIWMDTIPEGRFENTNKIWVNPDKYDYRCVNWDDANVDLIIKQFNLPDWKAPTTLMLGRYQPWHEGHSALLEKAHERTEQVVVGVRDTQGTSEKDPLTYKQVATRIRAEERSPFVVKFPNITNIVYGRDVGYKIEEIDLGADIHAISATQKREEMGL